MPIRKVRGGFKWGTHGKIYKSRKGAARQAAAAHANGFRGDSKRIPYHKLKAPASAENAYARALKKILGRVHKDYLASALEEQRLHTDAMTPHTSWLDQLGLVSLEHIKRETGKAFDKMAASVNGNSKRALRGIAPSDLRLGSTIQAARDANIALMENAGRAYAGQVREILEDPAWYGKGIPDLKAEIQKRGDVSESRAELIARDQTLKLNSAITKTRAENAGAKSYEWSTSQDERVRPEHAALEGKTFDFATGAPSLGGLNPSEDYQCRCIAVPIFASGEF